MSFLQKIAPRDSITLASYIAVVLFGLTLFIVRNKTKNKHQFSVKMVSKKESDEKILFLILTNN